MNHIVSHTSDHLPLILQNKEPPKLGYKGRRGFKFEEAWLLWDGCEQVIQEAWDNGGGSNSALETVHKKICGCASELLVWGASKTHPGVEEIKHLQKRIEFLNRAPPTQQNRSEFIQASKELDEWLRKQEIYWAQRSRVNWNKHGDKNSKFFHLKASQRRQKNLIQGIMDIEGRWVEDIEDVAGVAVQYFNHLFSRGPWSRIEECLEAVPHKVTSEMQ